MFSCKSCKIFMNSFFYRTPLVAASGRYEYTVYMIDLLTDCYNCFLFSLIEKHLNEPIIYFSSLDEKSFWNLSSSLVFETFQVHYTILLIAFEFAFILIASVRYFFTNFYFSPNDSPSETMKDVFYFIWKTLFVFPSFSPCQPLF